MLSELLEMRRTRQRVLRSGSMFRAKSIYIEYTVLSSANIFGVSDETSSKSFCLRRILGGVSDETFPKTFAPTLTT